MYDSHEYSPKFDALKERFEDIINDEAEAADEVIETLCDEVQNLYESGELPAWQYDRLMKYADMLT